MTLSDLFNHPIINLDKQIRYSNLKVVVPENVAEHSELVANIAMIIAIELNKTHPELKIDLKEIAYRGVIHDWGESVTCDVTTDVKYSRPELPKILEEVESKGLHNLKLSDELIHDINTAREGSIEGDLIMLADRLQSNFKMCKEYMIQRTQYWKFSVLNNSIPAVKECVSKVYEHIGNRDKRCVLDEITDGLSKLINILISKVDFL